MAADDRALVAGGVEQRVLPFDSAAALHRAEGMGTRKELGRRMSIPDGQIAGIARARRFSVATRDVRDFDECGLDVLNPFAS